MYIKIERFARILENGLDFKVCHLKKEKVITQDICSACLLLPFLSPFQFLFQSHNGEM